MNLRYVHHAQDMAGRAGLNEQAEAVGAGRSQRSGPKDEGRLRGTVVVAGKFGRAPIFDFEPRFDVLEQARLHLQDRPGVAVKIGIGVGPGCQRRRKKRQGQP